MVKTKTKKSSVKSATTRKSAGKSRISTQGAVAQEADSIYILKLVLYLILGSQWVRVTKGDLTIPLPIGLVVGILFARTDRFSIDRKIEYAILLLSMFIGFWLPLGIEFVL